MSLLTEFCVDEVQALLEEIAKHPERRSCRDRGEKIKNEKQHTSSEEANEVARY